MTVMPSERETSVSVTPTTAGGNGMGSTYMTGFVDQVYIAIAVGTNTTDLHVKITTSSTSKVIFTVNEPSTAGGYYKPRVSADLGGTTAVQAVHPTSFPIPISLYQERMQVRIPASTSLLATHVVSATLRINPLY